MITVLPCSSASRRAWVWGESGLALIVRALRHSRWLDSFSAARRAPAKFGIRPSAPGNREMPSRSIACQTSLRTSSLERTAETYPPRRTLPQRPMQGMRLDGANDPNAYTFSLGPRAEPIGHRRNAVGTQDENRDRHRGRPRPARGRGRLRLRQLPEG